MWSEIFDTFLAQYKATNFFKCFPTSRYFVMHSGIDNNSVFEKYILIFYHKL